MTNIQLDTDIGIFIQAVSEMFRLTKGSLPIIGAGIIVLTWFEAIVVFDQQKQVVFKMAKMHGRKS